jgi:hypothetical protein
MPPLTVVVVDDTLDYRQIVWLLLADLSGARRMLQWPGL